MKDNATSDFNTTDPYNRDYSIALLRRILSNNDTNAYAECRLITPGEEKIIATKIAELVSKNPESLYLGFLSIKGSTSKHRHAVTLVVNRNDKQIIYQYPKGTPIHPILGKAIRVTFADYNFVDLQIPQQKDELSCAVITVDNLSKLSQDKKINHIPDTQQLRQQHHQILANKPRGEPQNGKRTGKKFRIKSNG